MFYQLIFFIDMSHNAQSISKSSSGVNNAKTLQGDGPSASACANGANSSAQIPDSEATILFPTSSEATQGDLDLTTTPGPSILSLLFTAAEISRLESESEEAAGPESKTTLSECTCHETGVEVKGHEKESATNEPEVLHVPYRSITNISDSEEEDEKEFIKHLYERTKADRRKDLSEETTTKLKQRLERELGQVANASSSSGSSLKRQIPLNKNQSPRPLYGYGTMGRRGGMTVPEFDVYRMERRNASPGRVSSNENVGKKNSKEVVDERLAHYREHHIQPTVDKWRKSHRLSGSQTRDPYYHRPSEVRHSYDRGAWAARHRHGHGQGSHVEYEAHALPYRRISQEARVLIVDEDTRIEDRLQKNIRALEHRLFRNNRSALEILEDENDETVTPVGFDYPDRVLRRKHLIAWELALSLPMMKKGIVETTIPVSATHFYTRRISFWRRICSRLKICFTCVWRTPTSDIEVDSGLLRTESIEAFQQELNVMEYMGSLHDRTVERRQDIHGATKSMKKFLATRTATEEKKNSKGSR